MEQKKTYHHGDLRNALLDAVEQLVAEQGPSAWSLREVARRAGVSHGAPAHHFGNKAGMLSAFAAQGFDRLADFMRDALSAEQPVAPSQKLMAVGRGYVRFAAAHPAQFEIMFRPDIYVTDKATYKATSQASWRVLTNIIDEAAEAGMLDAADRDTVALTSWSFVHGLAVLWSGRRINAVVPDAQLEPLLQALTKRFAQTTLTRS